MLNNTKEKSLLSTLTKRFYITAIFVFIGICSLFVFDIYVQTKDIVNELRREALTTSYIIKQYRNSIMQDLKSLKDHLFSSNFSRIVLNSELKNNSKFNAIFIIKENEVFSAVQNYIPLPSNFNIESFESKIKNNGFYFSNFIFHENDFRKFVIYKIGSKDYILAFINSDDINNMLKSVSLSRNDNGAFVLNKQGEFVAASNIRFIKEHINIYDFYEAKINLEKVPVLVFSKNKFGDYDFVYFDKIENSDEIVGSRKSLFDIAGIYLIALGVISLVLLAIILFVFSDIKFLTKQIIVPIDNLNKMFFYPSKACDISIQINKDSKIIGEISNNIASIIKKLGEGYELSNISKKFENIFKNSSLVVLVADPDSGKILDASNAAIETYGYGDKFFSMSIFDLSAQSLYEYLYENYLAMYKKNNHMISKHNMADGTQKTVQIQKTYIASKTSPFIFYVIFDITKYQDFIQNTQLQREFINFSPYVMVVYDFDNDKIIDITKNTKAVWGYEYEKFIDGEIEFFSIINPFERDRVVKELKNNFNLLKNNKQNSEFIQKYKIIHSNGNYYNYKAIAKIVFSEKYNKSYLVFYLQNITDEINKEILYKKDIKRFQNIIDATSSVSWELSFTDNKIIFNDNFSNIVGYTERYRENKMSLDKFRSMIVKSDLVIFDQALKDYINGLWDKLSVEFRIIDAQERVVWVIMQGRTIQKDASGAALILCGTIENISERKQSELQLRLVASVFSNSQEGIVITDEAGKIIHVNEAFETITGYSKEESVGKNPMFLYSGDDSISFFKNLIRSLRKDGFWRGEIYSKRKKQESYPELLTVNAVKDSNNNVSNYVAMFFEITGIKEKEAKLEKIAHYDSLTKIPNRVFFAQIALDEMKKAKENSYFIAVLFIDFDGFKTINDTYGHDVGDIFLKETSMAMKNVLRTTDTIARLGGDEFGAILTKINAQQDIEPTLQRLLGVCQNKFNINGNLVQASCSIGVSFYPQERNVNFQELLSQADRAMYRAKTSGKNRYHIYNKIEDLEDKNIKSEKDRIKNSLKNGEFFMLYQPLINLSNSKIESFELLLRWMHPNMGMLLPGEFLFDMKGQILEEALGIFSVEECFKFQLWLKKEFSLDLVSSINCSVGQLSNKNFYDKFINLLQNNPEYNSEKLRIEVTDLNEKTYDKFLKAAVGYTKFKVEFALNNANIKNLKFIKNLPLSMIKIDRNICLGITEDYENIKIAKAIINYASKYHVKAVGQGVESYNAAKLLYGLGFLYLQGNYIGEAFLKEDVAEFIMNFKNSGKLIPMNDDEFFWFKLALNHKKFIKNFINLSKKQELLNFNISGYEKEYEEMINRIKFHSGINKSLNLKKHTEIHKLILDILTLDSKKENIEIHIVKLEREFDELMNVI